MNTDYRSLCARVKSVNADAGTWTAVASAPTVDRDDEVVAGLAFEPLPAQTIVRDGHFGGAVVGSGRPYYQGDTLMIDGRWASTPAGQENRTLVIEGHLTSMSVVFMPLEDRQVDGRRHITKGELLAVDWVDIPSNRDARVLVARGYGQHPTVAEARRIAHQAMLDLARLDLAEGRAILARTPAKSQPAVSDAEWRAGIADARRFLDDLGGSR